MTPDKVPTSTSEREILRSKTPEALAGRVLYERFLIERDLSDDFSGVACSVYLAKDLSHFCRKVILRAITPAEPGGRAGGFQEICDTLMRLDHPNIEWILETGRLFDGRPYAVATYTAGRALNHILHGDRRLVLDRIAHIVESVAEALGAAHSRKIIHGGITPSNIAMTSQEYEAENVRLVSFGTSWPADPGGNRFANIDLGGESLFYSAPELLTEDGRATPASDIYSLAAVAYRMLTGNVPFRATNREEMLELIAWGRPARPSDLRTDMPADAEALLLSALQYKASMRPRDARAFGIDLAHKLRGGARRLESSIWSKASPPISTFTEASGEIMFKRPAAILQDESKKRRVAKASSVVSYRAIAWPLIVLLLAGALSIPIGQRLLNEEQKPAAVSSLIKKSADNRIPRELRYLIEGQNVKNAPVSPLMLPRALANSGEYKMTFEADAAGNAYVFSEGADDQGRTIYNVLYPLPKINGGSAHIEAKQQAQTRPANFNESRGPEIIWLVWTAGNQDDLESARRAALDGDGVVRSKNDVEKLKHFLERNKNNKFDLRKDESTQQSVLNASGDKIVNRIELEHN